MSDAAPLVSVVMCVCNGQRYVESAIRSVLNQSFRGFELIVIDDGSTDATPGIVNALATKDARIRIVHQENRGIPRSANRGLQLARGRYLARHDADDLSLPDRLQRQADYLESHPRIVCVGGFIEMMDARARRLTTFTVSTDHERIDDELMRGHCSIWHTMCMMRTDAVRKVGGYNETFPVAEDIELFLRLGEIGQLANLPACVGRYRLHGGGVSQTKRQLEQDLCRRAVELAAARRGVVSRFEAHRDWRPGRDIRSRHLFACRYGWWAYNSGERRTAMIYGLKAVVLKPWSVEGWKLLMIPMLKVAAA